MAKAPGSSPFSTLWKKVQPARAGFSTPWKNYALFFHTVEKNFPHHGKSTRIFPRNGKTLRDFSTPWKNFGVIFPHRGKSGADFSTLWKKGKPQFRPRVVGQAARATRLSKK
jgi:hypothetical protein